MARTKATARIRNYHELEAYLASLPPPAPRVLPRYPVRDRSPSDLAVSIETNKAIAAGNSPPLKKDIIIKYC